MTDKEVNIKSSTIEKALEVAKDFLSKLIYPTVEEIGLLLADNIRFVRFKNQVNILLRAKKYIENNNGSVKEIPVKILVPLLENASLEENEELQDKWAKMLANMVDSKSNLQNQIFPYILGQLSIEEFNGLKKLSEMEKEYFPLSAKLHELKKTNKYYPSNEQLDLQKKVTEFEQSGIWVSMEQYEYANLERLGLLKQMPPKILIEEFKTRGQEEWNDISAHYDSDTSGYRLTELGDKFLEVCEIKDETSI